MTLPPDSHCEQLEAAREFAAEASGYIDSLRSLLTESDDPDLDEIFRLFHTIKGTAGFSGLGQVETLAHATETLLDCLRRSSRRFSAQQHNALETTVETLARMTLDLATVGDTRKAPRALIHDLQRLTPSTHISEKITYQGANESAYLAMERTGAAPVSADSATLGQLLAEAGICSTGSGSEIPVARPLQEIFELTRRNALHAARTVGRSVRLDFEGGNIPVSGSLDTALATTLLHTTRNAIGHGIETETERKILGKSSWGTVSVHAKLLNGELTVEIRDDGRGLNLEQIATQAVRKGLLKQDEMERRLASRRKQETLAELIFLPGLTTCKQVTSMAGMGVGMDAVKHAVHEAGGTIVVNSVPGVGTSFKLAFAVVQ